MAAAMNAPVSVLETAAEGGAWGIAVLAQYAYNSENLSLDNYLDKNIFSKFKSTTIEPDAEDVKGFEEYMKLYKSGLAVEKSAADNI